MRRITVFLAILIASLAALIALTAVGFAVYSSAQNPYGWMSQMWHGTSSTTGNGVGGMGGMMGQTGSTAATNPPITYLGVSFAVMIGLTVVGVVGLSYYLLYPQIRTSTAPSTISNRSLQTQTASAYDSVAKTLTPEERKIIDVLKAHNGKYLQKYIRNETGLSRLKTHRVIARLAERGMVSLEKTGNTNLVFLANWLQEPSRAQ